MGECRDYLVELEQSPVREGHLSLKHGFLAPEARPDRLPKAFSAWDELAGELPSLFFSNRTQEVMSRLPVLDAGEDSLPEAYLSRASVVLSTLAHAYWRFGVRTFYRERITQVPGDLPPGLLRPWQTISRRLGRCAPDKPFQSFYDLLLNNYKMAPGAEGRAPLIENIELLVPTFGGDTERVFYGAFVEMHWHFRDVIGAICRLEDALLADESANVCAELETMARCMDRASSVWSKLGSRPGSKTYCDPVLWSKTVAILGVPPALCPQGGTSGACAPILYVMDALLGRMRYQSYYGKYVEEEASSMVPTVVHRFAQRAARMSLPGYVASRSRSCEAARVGEAFRDLLSAYAGPKGWLGRHASKAFSYLCVSTITGRNASVSGHERYFAKQTWERAAQNLNQSRIERLLIAARDAGGEVNDRAEAGSNKQAQAGERRSGCPFAAHGSPRTTAPLAASTEAKTPQRVISRLELTRHIDSGDLWVSIDGVVCDLSGYAARHPGGAAILHAYAGQDVTEAFWQQNVHDTPAVRRALQRLAIGRLGPSPARDAVAAPLWAYLLKLLRARQAAKLSYEHSMGGDPRMKTFSGEHTHMLLWCDSLPQAFDALSPGLAARIARRDRARKILSNTQWLSQRFDFRGNPSNGLRRAMARRTASLAKRDMALLDDLLQMAREALDNRARGARAGLLPAPTPGQAAPARCPFSGKIRINSLPLPSAPGSVAHACPRSSKPTAGRATPPAVPPLSRLVAHLMRTLDGYFAALVSEDRSVQRTLRDSHRPSHLPLDLHALSAAG